MICLVQQELTFLRHSGNIEAFIHYSTVFWEGGFVPEMFYVGNIKLSDRSEALFLFIFCFTLLTAICVRVSLARVTSAYQR